ncbi:hypothetical protein MHA01_31100 [Marinococcus halophilus]|uniref:Uncharacterized protein n=2 Tax=Marinococcus halophilus TaxID=1371 RepID=A0A510YA07_MARHA|nr:hypothetical protein MHA01_31100 [Marinococcus halophilus]
MGMEKRYSQMSRHELEQEITSLNEKSKKAEQMGWGNEFAVYERKIAMAKTYLLDPADYQPGETYRVDQEGSTFEIEYINGVFAWGYRNNSTQIEALPFSLLVKK